MKLFPSLVGDNVVVELKNRQAVPTLKNNKPALEILGRYMGKVTAVTDDILSIRQPDNAVVHIDTAEVSAVAVLSPVQAPGTPPPDKPRLAS